MAQAFNHFVRFFYEHHQRASDNVVTNYGGWGCGIVFITWFWIFRFPMIALTVYSLLFASYIFGWIIESRKKKKVRTVPPELEMTWSLVEWLIHNRTLNARTHPEFRELLESLSATRRRTLDALKGDLWKARAKTGEGRQAVKDIKTTLDSAIFDAMFIGRHLFRAKGQRESSFVKNCQDPSFGRHALIAIGQIRDEVEELSKVALEAGEESDLRINLTRDRINALVEAERELETELGPVDWYS